MLGMRCSRAKRIEVRIAWRTFNGNEDSVQTYGVGWLLLCGRQFAGKMYESDMNIE